MNINYKDSITILETLKNNYFDQIAATQFNGVEKTAKRKAFAIALLSDIESKPNVWLTDVCDKLENIVNRNKSAVGVQQHFYSGLKFVRRELQSLSKNGSAKMIAVFAMAASGLAAIQKSLFSQGNQSA